MSGEIQIITKKDKLVSRKLIKTRCFPHLKNHVLMLPKNGHQRNVFKMKMKPSILLLLVFLGGFLSAQEQNPVYDEALAKSLGADDYGMKSYVFVILKTGNNKTNEKAFIDSCFAGHMDNIHRMTAQGKLLVAGPMGKNDQGFRGIFILDVASFEEADTLLKGDPAITSDILQAELFHWYGSAALGKYLEVSEKIWKKKP